MIPLIALVGRPNVGKSTLFNRLTRSRDALVADFPGLTRDRQYGDFYIGKHHFALIDTGGIYAQEQSHIDEKMAEQSLKAALDADLVLWLVDAKDGVTAADEELVQRLRQMDKPFWLVVNKTDGTHIETVLADFYRLGVERVLPISASQGRGLSNFKDELLDFWSLEDAYEESDDTPIEEQEERMRVAVLGRPNVGKSTLVNRMLGEDRVVVFDMPGTTRDSVYIQFDREDDKYTLIDTAGIRRRKNIKLAVEKFSIVKTLKAIDDAQVVVILIDAQEGLVDQDLHLLGLAIKAGRGIVFAVNKWDGLSREQKLDIKRELERRMQFIDYVQIHTISALHGSGVGDLFGSIKQVYASIQKKLATNQLTKILEGLVFDHPPPMINGRRIKLRYAHAGGQNPPRIVIHGNQVEKVPKHYVRYLEKGFRKYLKLKGTPIIIEFKGSDNPYANKKNTNRKAVKGNSDKRRSARDKGNYRK